ncbi:substrate-binding and VWA domain-containing protein [Amycolatopsis sp. H20-H5]|uniref:substrate-binding and VWA domain-containing protein n=1 Tax=Amycolatopsis sp. H20-H5 TaxID=3046309 RepID=UPI002DBDB1FA|nr:substrate-binding and VWA domain-containing protein [Amycolatopsis sp. H20-H5]MEC3977937.1 substrate-binding and VWA domain-containing protein [Amycolatopsis sp. H20-H5]
MIHENQQAAARRRRKFLSFGAAVLVAIGLIVGLRYLTSDNSPDPAAQAKCTGADAIALHVTASPEKSGIVTEIANDYSGRTVAGHCVDVLVQGKSSGLAMQALARGWNDAIDGPRPDVWTPAASGWVNLLRQSVAGSDRPAVLPDGDFPSIANSPLTIAMPKPMAEALGWPAKGIGWRELAALAADPAGWAKYNHPEWGKFRLGKTNPNISTAGLNATIGAYYAATGTSSDLTAAALAKPEVRQFVGNVEQAIVHYGDNTLTFLTNLQQADDRGAALSYISAVTVEENSLIGYNQGNPTNDPKARGQHAKPKVPLVAIYPSDGTLNSDHPYAVLNSADEARKQVAADFLGYLKSPEAQAKFTDLGFRTFEDKVGPQATPENGVQANAKINLIRPPGPAVLDALLKSWTDLRKKANVLLVVDVSGSMGDPVKGTGKSKMDLAKQAAATSLAQFGDKDQVGLWMFSTQLSGDKDYQELVTVGPVGDSGRRDQLKGRLEGLTPQNGTGLYDSSLAAYQYMKQHLDPNAINAVVVLTDGRNEDQNGVDLNNLVSQLKTEGGGDNVRVFTIAYGGDADQDVLRQIAQATQGSEYDSSKPDSIDQVFTAVISNF